MQLRKQQSGGAAVDRSTNIHARRTTKRSAPRVLASLAAVSSFVLAPSIAGAADKKAECAAAYEQSQELRASAKLRAAREALVICAQGACPSFVQADCTHWLAELQNEMPTVVVAAKGENGSDVSGVRVSIDGIAVEAEHEGAAIPVDPGRHVFHFEREGLPSVDREIVVRQGEKDRILDVSFALESRAASASTSPPASAADTSKPEPSDDGKPGPLRPYAYAAGGVGAAGIIGFMVFGLVGKGQQSDLERSGCSPNCSADSVDSVKTKYILADVSLGLGIAGLGAGVALFFLSQPHAGHSEHAARASVQFDVKTVRDGAYATVESTF